MTNPLSDAQCSLLTAAAAREDGSIYPVAGNLKGGAIGNVCRSLLRRGLIKEAHAAYAQTVWRCDDGGTPLTLRITDAGVAAVRPDGKKLVEVAAPTPPAGNGDSATRSPVSRAGKQEALVTLLRRSEGATVAELQDATGWQPHSVRGALSGIVRKKLGHELVSAKEERGRVYRIAS